MASNTFKPIFSDVVSAEATAKSLFTWTHIRDRIVIDQNLQAKILAQGIPFVTLIAREITHAPGFDLTLPGYQLLVVASTYDGNGRSINVSGAAGSHGQAGSHGKKGYASIPRQQQPWRSGRRGEYGRSGASRRVNPANLLRTCTVPTSSLTAARAGPEAQVETAATEPMQGSATAQPIPT